VITALIADDHAIVREGVRRLLEAEEDVQVCCEASDGREVLEQIELRRPDVVILDVMMPRLGGFETLERVRNKYPELKVILLSVHSDTSFVQSARNLGANGYLLKNGRVSEIVSAVRSVMDGKPYFNPPMAVEGTPRDGAVKPFEILSAREREVLQLIAEGQSAREIAVDLGISPKTVEAHRTSIMRKLGARKATELVRYALRHGLIEP
jgi:DNA-binding NarL/FixJ family response regulator